MNGYERLEKGDFVGDHSDRVTTVPGLEKRAWWKDRDILVACGSYGMLALVFIILGEGLKIFSRDSAKTMREKYPETRTSALRKHWPKRQVPYRFQTVKAR